MAMAGLGAVIAMTFSALIAWRYDRDFAREFTESLKLKHTAPLGEEEIARIQTGSAEPEPTPDGRPALFSTEPD